MQWHINFDESLDKEKREQEVLKSPGSSAGSEDELEKGETDNKVKTMFDRQYVKSKLEQGLNRIWQVCLSFFRFEEN